jgi:type IV pilus assembly protein PilC
MILVAAILLFVLYIYLGFKRPVAALTTSPLLGLAAIIIYFNLTTGFKYDNEDLFIALVVVIAIFPAMVGIALVKSIGRASDIGHGLLTLFILIAKAAGLLLLLVALLAVFKPLGLVFWAVFVAAVINYQKTSARANTMHVISTIGASMRQNLPLAMALETAAANRRERRAQILRRISKWLVQGYSLGEAIKKGYPKCPSDIVATISTAEKINQLPQAIRSIEANITKKADDSRRIQPISLAYVATVLLVATLILFFLMIKIVPVFAEVQTAISDGEMQLPKSTTFLLNLTSAVIENTLLLVILWIVFASGVCVWIYAKFMSRRPQQPYLVSRIIDFIKWHLPIKHWFELNYSMLRLVGLLRVSLNAGCSVNDSIRSSLALDINSCFRKRISKWLKRVERGENISSAAQKSKMGSALVWAFDDKANQGNTPAILEMLEEFYRSNYSYRANLAKFILEPCTVLMLGFIVGFVVRAMFEPMVAMVSYLADTATP